MLPEASLPPLAIQQVWGCIGHCHRFSAGWYKKCSPQRNEDGPWAEENGERCLRCGMSDAAGMAQASTAPVHQALDPHEARRARCSNKEGGDCWLDLTSTNVTNPEIYAAPASGRSGGSTSSANTTTKPQSTCLSEQAALVLLRGLTCSLLRRSRFPPPPQPGSLFTGWIIRCSRPCEADSEWLWLTCWLACMLLIRWQTYERAVSSRLPAVWRLGVHR